MNGISTSNYAYDDGLLSPIQAFGPYDNQIMEGYRKDAMNGFGREKPHVNPVSCTCRICLGLPPAACRLSSTNRYALAEHQSDE